MNKPNRKRQHVEQQEEKDNVNVNQLREPEMKMAAVEAKNDVLSAADLAKVNEENGALEEKLKEAEEKAQMSNNEMDKPEITQESPDRHRRVPLSLELNCQIFACLKFESQRKFIGGLGRGIYGMFRQKVLKKSKRLCNPEQNGWEVSNTGAIIYSNGVLGIDNTGWENVFAKKGFPITGQLSRTDNFPGTILYYFEVANISTFRVFCLGLSSEHIIPDGSWVGGFPNSYAIHYGFDNCWLSGTKHPFERPTGAIKPKWNGQRDVVGCGLMLNPENKLSIFFTGNGILMGKQISINPTTNLLYPTVTIYGYGYGSVEANFGDNPAKPFCYDIKKCPGMVLE